MPPPLWEATAPGPLNIYGNTEIQIAVCDFLSTSRPLLAVLGSGVQGRPLLCVALAHNNNISAELEKTYLLTINIIIQYLVHLLSISIWNSVMIWRGKLSTYDTHLLCFQGFPVIHSACQHV